VSAGLRIGYLVQQFPPEVGAGPARVTEMALRWKAAGAEVTVFTAMPNRPEGRIHPAYRGKLFMEEEWRGIRVLRSWLYASPRHGFARTLVNNASFMLTGALQTALKGRGLDVLIASSPPFFPHLSGTAVAGLRRVPLVLEVRDLWPDYLVGMNVLREGLPTRGLFALERWMLRRAEHVVVVTDSFRRRVREKGVPDERIDVIPNGVDTSFYRPAGDPPPPPPLPALQWRPGEFLVTYLGNFGQGQGLTTVVDAAALLAAEGGPPVRFVMAGDGPERARVEAHAAEAGLSNLSIHPPIPKDATPAFYTAGDLCLVPLAPFPILQETIPSKIFEVMACERPVLAALGGEGAQIVERSGGGLVVPPGDPRAMADAIRRVALMDADARAEMGRRGRAFVGAEYARERLADRYLEILRGVHARAGGAA
jgi:colanic acid biosynthesis glycosyl transferase WcaI